MRFGILSTIFTILLDMLVFTAMSMRQNEVIYESQQRLMDMQVNYATDAAAWMMLNETPDIDIDYTDLSDIKVDPQVALATYEALMVRAMGWGDTQDTRDYFETSYMPFFIVAAYDGYYVYGVVRDEEVTTLYGGNDVLNKTFPKIWSPKIPYATSDYNESNSLIYMYTLGGDTYTLYDYNTDQYVPDNHYTGSNGLGSKQGVNELISTVLTEACQKSLLAAKGQPGIEQIIIPSNFSKWSSNRPIEYPTVLTYVDGSYSGEKFNHTSFAIGGSRIEEANYYIAYISNGERLYTDAMNRKDVEENRGCTIDHVYASPVDAALSGYTYDIKYLK